MSKLQSIKEKRVMREMTLFNKNKPEGVYLSYKEDDLMKFKAMVIGPEDTPYQYGYYFFDFSIPDDYPFSPPKAKFHSKPTPSPCNPNLYLCGKVCVSILNTAWGGKEWSSSISFFSIMVSIQTILNKYPFRNQTFGENLPIEQCELYNVTVKMYNLLYIKEAINNDDYPEFRYHIMESFLKNYDKICADYPSVNFATEKEKAENYLKNTTVEDSYGDFIVL